MLDSRVVLDGYTIIGKGRSLFSFSSAQPINRARGVSPGGSLDSGLPLRDPCDSNPATLCGGSFFNWNVIMSPPFWQYRTYKPEGSALPGLKEIVNLSPFRGYKIGGYASPVSSPPRPSLGIHTVIPWDRNRTTPPVTFFSLSGRPRLSEKRVYLHKNPQLFHYWLSVIS